ncbi:MAG: pseudouridine synthase [Fibrobacterales bacterium]
MRLDKFIADTTNLSRKEAGKVIKQGRITVAGKVNKKASDHVDLDSEVTIDDDLLTLRTDIYIMMHKPKGVICSTKDSHNETVLAFLDEDIKMRAPAAAGRLDKDVTGLVLLTNDGVWNHNITSPRKDKFKIYQVIARDLLSENDVTLFKKGITLSGDDTPCKPAELILKGGCEAELRITEGRYHQVKRMFEEIGNEVVELHRTEIAGIVLDNDLQPGQWRELTEEEIAVGR